MRILYISQYFPPEMGAPSARVYELASHWLRMGHEVKVLTAFPNHPTGIVPEDYRGEILRREFVDGIEVIRTWVFATPNKGFTKRIANYLSFPISATLLGIPLAHECDVVIATSPQFFVGAAGYMASRFKKKPFIFEVRDLWPDTIIAVGALKNKLILELLRSMERFLYKRASGIVAVAESAGGVISQRAGPYSRVAVIPNGVDMDFFRSDGDSHRDNEQFLVSYIGTHGLCQGLEVVLDAAEKLKGYNIKFLFVGEGAEKEKLMQDAQRRRLSSVSFLPGQPRELVPQFYKDSDVCLVVLKDRDVFSHTIPSKMFEIMACARPIVLAVKGESRRVLEQAHAGIPVEPENASELADAILRLYNNAEQAEIMGCNGRAFVEKHYSRGCLSEKYIHFLASICE